MIVLGYVALVLVGLQGLLAATLSHEDQFLEALSRHGNISNVEIENLKMLLRLNVESYVLSYGYPLQTHQVVTPDGYVLTMHRMPHGRDNFTNEVKPVVFLQHGLTAASHTWFMHSGPEEGFAYNLADAGFDVWMGNARGNIHSRRHINLNPDDEQEKLKFFDFTWDEIGNIDLPAMFDYILNLTGQKQLHYIGHSQGGTVFLVLNSLRPEYNAKIKSAHLMAGVGYMQYFPSTILRLLAANTNNLYALARRNGFVEVPKSPFFTRSGFTMEDEGNMTKMDLQTVNEKALSDMIGLTKFQELYRTSAVNSALNYLLSLVGGQGGAAIKQFAHYGQNIQTKTFQRWDHGSADNIKHYGTSKAPVYDLSRITVDTVMHYSMSDAVLDERDVLAMAAVMPNAITRRIPRETFSHIDFIGAYDAKEHVTTPIIAALWEKEETIIIPLKENAASLPVSFSWLLISCAVMLNVN